MLDINGDLSEAIDNKVSEIVNEESIFMKALGGASSAARQSQTFEAIIANLFEEDLAEEMYGFLRLNGVGIVMSNDANFAKSVRLGMFVNIFDRITLEEKDEDGVTIYVPILTDEKQQEVEEILKDATGAIAIAINVMARRLTLEARTYATFLPSELIKKMPNLYKTIVSFMNDKVGDVNKVVQDLSDKFKEEYDDQWFNDEDRIRGMAGARTTTPTRPLPEGLNEEQLVTTVIDLEKLKSEEMNEIFLAQFGGAIELILNAMFNTRPLPVAITGAPRDVSAFAGALGGEKKYLEAAKKYGLNHPSTYKNKAKLSNAVKKFEKQTGIKWPFK
jgi:hypothetical protein